MALVDVARYRTLTGDLATPDVTVVASLATATDMLADALGRAGIEEATYSEWLLPTRDGRLHPSVTPLASCADYAIDGDTLVAGWFVGTPGRSVTYIGGWTSATVPRCIEADLANAARTIAAPDTSGVPSGATSARLGDAAVTYGPQGARPNGGAQAVTWSRPTLRYRHRVPRGA